jgi:hypothetical protein
MQILYDSPLIWRFFDIDAFVADLQQSALTTALYTGRRHRCVRLLRIKMTVTPIDICLWSLRDRRAHTTR